MEITNLINIKKIINKKIDGMATKKIKKLFYDFNLNMNIESNTKLVQLESEIIKCDLKKRGADISIILILALMIVTIF